MGKKITTTLQSLLREIKRSEKQFKKYAKMYPKDSATYQYWEGKQTEARFNIEKLEQILS